MRSALLLAVAGLMLTGTLPAAGETVVQERVPTQYEPFRLVQVADGLEHPWAVALLPDGRKLVTERPGRVQLIENGQRTEIGNVPEVAARNQGGLLEIVAHPDYEENGWLYLTYSQGNGDGTATTLVRARLEGDQLADVEELFVQDRFSSPGRHYGSRVVFLDDGTLLMSIGDRGTDPPRAQDLDDHAGTLIRLNDDGSVPDDNPFVDDDEVLPEIYSYGHRNIQGMIVHPETGEVWVTDHGPRGGDRLDRIEPGMNYGWPVATFGRDYRTQEHFSDGDRTRPGIMPPVYELLPTLAPSGLVYVDGQQLEMWEGDLLAGGLRGREIRRLVLGHGPIMHVNVENGRATIPGDVPVEGDYVAHVEAILSDEIGRIRDLRADDEGRIYILTDARDGGLYRIEAAD